LFPKCNYNVTPDVTKYSKCGKINLYTGTNKSRKRTSQEKLENLSLLPVENAAARDIAADQIIKIQAQNSVLYHKE
jgi:hypothetical protein